MVRFRIKDNQVFKLEDNKPPVAVGSLQGGFFIAQRDMMEHLHFVHDGWGVDCGLVECFLTNKGTGNVELLQDINVHYVKINNKTFDEDYYTDLGIIRQFGIREEYGEHGEQYILPRIYWSLVNDYERRSEGFVHLHVHSDYSLLDGMGKIEEYVFTAKRMGMKALALTDHGNVIGLSKFHKVCKQAGIKPILGSEFYVVGDISVKERKDIRHIVLLAKNYTGYRNLLRLSTKSFLEGFYYKPRISKASIVELGEGLIVLSACAGGQVCRLIEEGKVIEAEQEMMFWKTHFGEDYYLELQADSLEVYCKCNPTIVELAKKCGVPLVASVDVHYTYQKDRSCHDILLGIQKRKSIHDKPGFEAGTYWFTSKEETEKMYEQYQTRVPYQAVDDAIKNTEEVARKIGEYEITTTLKLPSPVRSTSLSKICFDRMFEAGLKGDEYVTRLSRELDVIAEMEFEDYFLMLQEVIEWAKSKGIRVGAGRGSVAGSLVAYVLGITQVDPLRFGLLFERFLNIGRKVAPDIDIDFDSLRRDEVIEFIKGRYNTARISTVVRLNGRGIVRDGAKVCGVAPWSVELLAKSIPFNHSIDKAYVYESQFRGMFDDHKEDMLKVRRLEGVIKTVGLHPAGVIISDEDIGRYFALRLSDGSTGEAVVQGCMEDVDYVGLIKVDFLGSKTQTILDMCCKAVGIELNDISLDREVCPRVYEEFSKGNCEDIFQFNSELARDTLKKVKPDNFEDLTAVTALIRPGAGDFIDAFAKRDYDPLIDDMKGIVGNTRNIILYQEQSMLVAQKIAGFSLEKADDLRKAIGKKIPKLMASLRQDFINGGAAKGYDKKIVSEVFDIIERSSWYSFNKSHAIAYTLSSYWCMWFKCYHPIAYAVAEMTVEGEGDRDKLKRYIETTKAQGVVMYPPDINKSEWGFTAEKDGVRCGLSMVKRFSENGYDLIKEKRPFKGFTEFMEAISDNKRMVNKGAVECLINAGAFDTFGTRKALGEALENWQKLIKQFKGKEIVLVLDDKELSIAEKGQREFEALGFYLTVNPIEPYKKQFKGVTPWDDFQEYQRGQGVLVAGVIGTIKPYKSKNGEMAFIEIGCFDHEYSLNVWAEAWKTYKKDLNEGDIVLVKGQKLDEDKVSVGEKDTIKRLNQEAV